MKYCFWVNEFINELIHKERNLKSVLKTKAITVNRIKKYFNPIDAFV